MARTNTTINNVKAIRVQPVVFNDFVSHEFTFDLEDGSEVTVCGFADGLLNINVQEQRNANSLPETA